MKLSVAFFLSGVLMFAQSNPPKLIDCPSITTGRQSFLDQLTAKLDAVDGMALLITAPADIKGVKAAMAAHPAAWLASVDAA